MEEYEVKLAQPTPKTTEETLLELLNAAEEVAWMLWQRHTLGMGVEEYKDEIRTVRGMFKTSGGNRCFLGILKMMAGVFDSPVHKN